jgi:hypothetical protein
MSIMMPSTSSNLKSKINAFNSSNGKKEEPSTPKPKVSSSISDRIKRLSTGEAPTELSVPTAKVSTTSSNTPTSITIAGPKVASTESSAQKNGKVVEIERVYKKNNADSTTSQTSRSSRFDTGGAGNNKDNGSTSSDGGRASFFNRVNDNIKKNSEKATATAASSSDASLSTPNNVNIKKDTANSNNFTIMTQSSSSSSSSSADNSDMASVRTITNSSLPRSNKFDENFGPSIDSSSSSTSTIDCSNIPSTNPMLAVEEDMSIAFSSLVLAQPSSVNNHLSAENHNSKEGKLTISTFYYRTINCFNLLVEK